MMIRNTLLIALLLLLSSNKCNTDELNKIREANAVIHKQITGRASWQWYLTIKEDTFMSNNISKELQVDGLETELTFRLTDTTETLYQVGPVDLPEKVGTYPLIEIVSFKLISK